MLVKKVELEVGQNDQDNIFRSLGKKVELEVGQDAWNKLGCTFSFY